LLWQEILCLLFQAICDLGVLCWVWASFAFWSISWWFCYFGKQKERQDITGSNCLKGVSRKVIVDEKGIKDSWKEYMKKLMNEENGGSEFELDGLNSGKTSLIFLHHISSKIASSNVIKLGGKETCTLH